MFFAKLLTEILEVRGIKQSELAKKLHKDRGILTRFKLGTQEPNWSQILVLAAELNLEPADFFPSGFKIHTKFIPWFNEHMICRPHFADQSGRIFLYSIYAYHDFTILNLESIWIEGATYVVYVVDGSFRIAKKTYNKHDYLVLRKKGDMGLTQEIKKGTRYLVFVFTEHETTMEKIVSHRFKNLKIKEGLL